MIVSRNLVPEVYYNKSRDFQLLGRTFDVIFNYLKNNTSSIYDLPISDDSDSKLVDLMCLTLGFKQLHSYNIRQLKGLCSIFELALRNKGNIQSIELVLNMLLNVEGIKKQGYVSYDPTIDNYTVQVYVPTELRDMTLFNDMLNYILPAGMSCRIVRNELIKGEDASTIINQSDSINTSNVLVKAYINSSVPTYQNNVIASDLGPRNDNATIIGYEEEVK